MIKRIFLILFIITSLILINENQQLAMGSRTDVSEKWFPPHIHDEFSIMKSSDEIINLSMKQNEVTNISANVGDVIKITVSLGDNLNVEYITFAKLITNFSLERHHHFM